MTIKRLTKADLPNSMGAFKPVGHVLIAFRSDAQAQGATQALREAGFEAEDILDFSCAEQSDRMDQMLEHASEFAGFGYEIVLMRRYQELCKDGCSWLLVYAPHEAEAQRVGEAAQRFGALTAVKYHRLVEEDLV
jgi:hypothetical protein